MNNCDVVMAWRARVSIGDTERELHGSFDVLMYADANLKRDGLVHIGIAHEGEKPGIREHIASCPESALRETLESVSKKLEGDGAVFIQEKRDGLGVGIKIDSRLLAKLLADGEAEKTIAEGVTEALKELHVSIPTGKYGMGGGNA